MEARYPTTGRLLMLANVEAKKEAAKAASMCEERLRFDPVPVHDVTLAEAITPTYGTPYEVQLPENTRIAYVYIKAPQVTTASQIECRAWYADNSVGYAKCNGATSTSDTRMTEFWFSARDGMSRGIGTTGNGGPASFYNSVPSSGPLFPIEANITKIAFDLPVSGADLPIDTRIAVYAASLNQRVTDVFGTELEEVTSEQIHSLFV